MNLTLDTAVATEINGSLVLDFGGGDSLTLIGVTSIDAVSSAVIA